MRDECIHSAAAAMGRQLTAGESKDIEQRVVIAMRNLARQDPAAWAQKSAPERLQEAGAAAAQSLIAERELKQRRDALTVLARSRIDKHIADVTSRKSRFSYGKLDVKSRLMTGLDAIDRLVAFHADGKSNFLSIETQAKAIESDALRQMIDTLEASDPKWFGLYENRAGIEALVKELFGEDSGTPAARKGAAEFHTVAEQLRERFNRSGGDVGQLEDWGLPHHHSQLRVAKAGREAWIADVMPRLNRDAYFNADGVRMTDAELVGFLDHAWATIATGGANKVEPGQFRGTGARANRGNEARQIHFKDAQSYLDYQQKYGDRSLYEVLVGHLAGVAKDIAHVETFGPNPDATYRYLRDAEVKNAKLADPVNAGKIDQRAVSTDNLYNVVSGKTQPVSSEWLAKSFDTLRNWLMATRLGSSVITSFSDDATLHLTGQLNNLPAMRLLANELATFNPANRMEERLALRAGLGMQTLISSLNRFGQDGLGRSWSSKLANATIRASGLNAMTEARRRAFGTTFMHALGAITREHADLSALDANDHRILLSKGITPGDFAVWKKAQLEDWGGGNDTMLTPESIYRIPDAELAPLGDPQTLKEQAATRLLGIVLEETDVAVVEPGAKERAQMGGTLPRGTWKGELTRSFFLFKSFPMAMIERHWARGMGIPNGGGKAAYLATLLAATTVLGMASLQVNEVISGRDPRKMFGEGSTKNWIAAMVASTSILGGIAVQINELLGGRDPRDMTSPRFALQALLKGGSLGIYGDFLFSDATQHGGSLLSTLEGPLFGTAEDFLNLTQGNVVQWMQGKDMNLGAETTKFVRSLTPGASLWYAKAAFDHLIFHQLQEYFSPGYLAKMRRRSEREFGQRFWWEPGEVAPSRPPDLDAAVGD